MTAEAATGGIESQTFFRDWDYFASMVESLRIYLFDHGTIPTWNYMICGGKPELANPQSWAYTWPSIFAYALTPYLALLTVWVVLTALGIWATATLFKRWGMAPLPAWTAACLYGFNGYFGAHFNQGHVTFAFFHLIPMMILALDRYFAAHLALGSGAVAGSSTWSLGARVTVISFAFFTAALPHPLFYFFPAVLLYLLCFVVGGGAEPKVRKPRLRLFIVAKAIALMALGVLLGAYKFWPIVAFQLEHPRQGVLLESMSLGDVVADTLIWVKNLDAKTVGPVDGMVWGYWEYHAFVGPVAWVLSLCGVLFWLRAQALGGRSSAAGDSSQTPLPLSPRGVWLFSFALLVLGLDLALGNASPGSVAKFFAALPLLNGIRVFGRFAILTVFGLCGLTGLTFSALRHRWAGKPYARSFDLLLAVLVCGPAFLQWVVLAATVRSESYAEAATKYSQLFPPQLEKALPGRVPPSLANMPRSERFQTLQTLYLKRGYWVANCYEPLTIDRVSLEGALALPMTTPAPESLMRLDHDSLALSYPKNLTGPVVIGLPLLQGYEFNVPVALDNAGRINFRAEDLHGEFLQIRHVSPADSQGLWLSICGVGIAFLLKVRQRLKRSLVS